MFTSELCDCNELETVVEELEDKNLMLSGILADVRKNCLFYRVPPQSLLISQMHHFVSERSQGKEFTPLPSFG